ncbi:TPA: helix-turn-helix transcriptional regulator [Staphylococcus aureus]|nr:helix-turn-helix transcriptional regulator [Staphylococcus aureus]
MNQEGTLGNAIRKARKNEGYTLEKLGEKIGKTHAYLSRIENNKVKPSNELLKKIAKQLDPLGFEDYLNEFRILAGYFETIDENSDYYNDLKASGRLEIDFFDPDKDLPFEIKEKLNMKVRNHKKLVEKPYYKLNYLLETKFDVFYDIKIDQLSEKILTIQLPKDFIRELYKVINMKIIELIKEYPELLDSIKNPETVKNYEKMKREKLEEFTKYAHKNIENFVLFEDFIQYFYNNEDLM